MSLATAAKEIRKGDPKLSAAEAAHLARAARAAMPGTPPTKAIVAEAHYIARRSRENKPLHALGSGLRFRRQVDAIVDGWRAKGEVTDAKEARQRASAIAARQFRDAYGDAYAQYLASRGKKRATIERKAEAEGTLRRLPRRAASTTSLAIVPAGRGARAANPTRDWDQLNRTLREMHATPEQRDRDRREWESAHRRKVEGSGWPDYDADEERRNANPATPLETFTNIEDGTEANIFPNTKSGYNVVFKDIDSGETIAIFTYNDHHDRPRAIAKARELVFGEGVLGRKGNPRAVRRQNPVSRDESVLNQHLLRLPGGRWRASDAVHVECDDHGYCVVVQGPKGPSRHRVANPVEAVQKARTLIVAGSVNPNAPKTPDRRGKPRANPVVRYPNPAPAKRRCNPAYDEDLHDTQRAEKEAAMEQLTRTFGRPTGGNADWSSTAWYVAGEGAHESRNPNRPDIHPGLYADRSLWVVDMEDENEFCVMLREQGTSDEEDFDDRDDLFCASASSIEAVIAQARFHAARLFEDTTMPSRSRGARQANPSPILLPRKAGDSVAIQAHGHQLQVKKLEQDYFAKIDGEPRGRFGDAKQIRDDIRHFLTNGTLPRSTRSLNPARQANPWHPEGLPEWPIASSEMADGFWLRTAPLTIERRSPPMSTKMVHVFVWKDLDGVWMFHVPGYASWPLSSYRETDRQLVDADREVVATGLVAMRAAAREAFVRREGSRDSAQRARASVQRRRAAR